MDQDSKLITEAYRKVVANTLPKKSYPGYDHVHWTIVNGEPLDDEMGTTNTGGHSNPHWIDGQIYLIGRDRTGYHRKLEGPLTKEEYLAMKNGLEDELDVSTLHQLGAMRQ